MNNKPKGTLAFRKISLYLSLVIVVCIMEEEREVVNMVAHIELWTEESQLRQANMNLVQGLTLHCHQTHVQADDAWKLKFTREAPRE